MVSFRVSHFLALATTALAKSSGGRRDEVLVDRDELSEALNVSTYLQSPPDF